MFCQNCGESVQDKGMFCPKCGAPTFKETEKPGRTSESNIASQESRAIWNPNAASNWSLIFTPAFGSYIHAENWRTLGETDRAGAAMRWFYFSVFVLIVFLFTGILVALGEMQEGATQGLGLLYLLIWYFSAGKVQANYVKEKLGNDYARKGWGKPLLIAVAAIVAYVFITAAVLAVLNLIMGAA